MHEKTSTTIASGSKKIYQKKQSQFSRGGHHIEVTKLQIAGSAAQHLDEVKVSDHCHYSGVFLGYAHNQCNSEKKHQLGASYSA